jgi:HEAT repeat protein
VKRRWLVVLVVVALVVAGGGLAAWFDPAARVPGWVGGEPFFQGRSATAWRRDLRKTDEVATAAAQKALADGKGDAVAVCAWLLSPAHAPETPVRLRAADALRQMGKAAAPAAAELVAALADPEQQVRGVVAQAVGELAPDVPGAVPALVKQFPDRDAIRAVARFKAAGAAAVPQLVVLLKSENVDTRRQAVRALGKIGEPARPHAAEIVALTDSDPEPGVQEQAAEALGDIGPLVAAEAIPALVRALKHHDEKVRGDAVRALGQMGPAAKGVLAEVKAILKDPDERARGFAEKAVRQIDPSGK